MTTPEQKTEYHQDTAEIGTHELMDCLLLLAGLEGRPTSLSALSSGLPLVDGKLTPELFNRAANRAGLASILLARQLDNIPQEVLPCVLLLNNGQAVVLSSLDAELQLAVLTDPHDNTCLLYTSPSPRDS